MSRYRWRYPGRLGVIVVGVVISLFLIVAFADMATAQDEERFDFIILKDKSIHVGTAEYVRELPGGGVWLDGDRVGYSKVYAFLDCNPANVTLNMRVAAFAYTTTVKATIIDKFMMEGTRYWDGTLDPDGLIPARTSDAPRLLSHGAGWPTSVPVITVVGADGEICETRNYANVVQPHASLTWAVIEDTPTQVIIGWYWNGLPAVEFYYEIIGGTYHLEVA